MEIPKGSIPPIVKKEEVEADLDLQAKLPDSSPKSSANADLLEIAAPPNAFDEVQKQGLGEIVSNIAKEEGGAGVKDLMAAIRPETKLEKSEAKSQPAAIRQQTKLEEPFANSQKLAIKADVIKKDESESSSLLDAVVNTEAFQLKERLQNALDATLPLRMLKAGASATDIAAAMKEQGASAEDVANTLKGLGFSGEEVAVALRNEYQLMPMQLGETMKAAGFDATEIAKGLKEAWSQDSGQIRDILEALGFTQQEIADAMWGAFQIGEYTTLD